MDDVPGEASREDQTYEVGWTPDGHKEAEMLVVFSGRDAEVQSRTLLVDTWTWIAMDETDPKVADLHWEAADWLLSHGENVVFELCLKGVKYWRRVLI
jgi:hypothetical protein